MGRRLHDCQQVLFRFQAREKILHGAAQLADAVRITLGPKSKSVLIQKKWGAPLVCNDGVTIAKETEHADDLGLSVRDNVVTLSGVVTSEEERRLAEYGAWHLAGVRDVVNRLEVRRAAGLA